QSHRVKPPPCAAARRSAPTARPPSLSARQATSSQDRPAATFPHRIRLAPPWESYNHTATTFAPLTFWGRNCLKRRRHCRTICGRKLVRSSSAHERPTSLAAARSGGVEYRGDQCALQLAD